MKANKKLMTKKEIIKEAINSYTLKRIKKVDKRYTAIKKFLSLGYTEQDLLKMREKREKRIEFRCKEREYKQKNWEHAERVDFLRYLKTCKYYKEVKDNDFDFSEDYCVIHRPTSNGRSWVMIAPGERANNYYTEDPVLVKFLYKKYNLQFKN